MEFKTEAEKSNDATKLLCFVCNKDVTHEPAIFHPIKLGLCCSLKCFNSTFDDSEENETR